LNVVDPSVVVESVELGRDTADVGRRVEGPAPPVFRIVVACDRTDGDKEERSAFGATFLAVAERRTEVMEGLSFDSVVLGNGGIMDSAVLDRTEAVVLGVSFESGRGPGGGWALRLGAAVLAREVVDRVFDFTELADDMRDGSRVGVTLRRPVFPRRTVARRLMESLSASSLFTTSLEPTLEAVLLCDGEGLKRSSTDTSISPLISLMAQPSNVSNPHS
jgi:hypothetical protein